MSGNVLSLLGLALRGGRLVPGDEPSALAAKTGQSRLLLAASDASPRTLRRIESLAQEGHCLWLVLPFTKEELGGALGRGGTAIAALTDTGLAAAVTERLAQLDPERYGEAAARMDLKRRRAKERQSAPRRDPPKKAPPPGRGDRRSPESRRKGGQEGRLYASKEGRKPEAWRDRPPKDGAHASQGRHEKPGRPGGGGKRLHGEDGRRPYDRPPKEGRPYGKPPKEGRPHDGPPQKGQDRFQRGKPGGGRFQSAKEPGKSRPFKNKGGPRSRSGNSSGGRGPDGGGSPNGNPTRRRR